MITKRVITNIAADKAYLVRWSLKLHQILRADDDRCTHDHPWLMVRAILWGGYVEEYATVQDEDIGELKVRRLKPWRPWAPWRIYTGSLAFRHRIKELPRGSSWSLVLCGPKSDTWGFYLHGGYWMHWRQFVDAARSARVLWCEDGQQRGEGE